MKLWEKGVVSNETLLQTYGYDMKQEEERLKKEKAAGTFQTFEPPKTRQGDAGMTTAIPAGNTDTDDVTVQGRPTMDDSERHSDPSKSITGRQPKGSNPEGSEAQDTT